MFEDKESIEYRIKIFKEGPLYKWPPPEFREDKIKSTRGRKPAPSKKILSVEPTHNKWWRT
jgi:hypothetical protein